MTKPSMRIARPTKSFSTAPVVDSVSISTLGLESPDIPVGGRTQPRHEL
jgi:hypothetical protein